VYVQCFTWNIFVQVIMYVHIRTYNKGRGVPMVTIIVIQVGASY
jgi:hypothetical protein